MLVRFTAITLTACALTGCASIQEWADRERGVPQTPSGALIENTDEADKITASLRTYTDKLMDNRCKVVKSLVEKRDAQGNSVFPAPTDSDLAAYTSCAVQRVDDMCYRYFAFLDRSADGSRFGRREFNSIADYSSLLLGVTEAPAEAITVLSGTRVAIGDTWNATEDMLMLSPSPFKVHKLVRDKQAAIKAAYIQGHNSTKAEAATPDKIEAALLFVRDYSSACSRIGIHRMLDEAIQTQVANNSPNASINTKLNDALKTVNETIKKTDAAAPTLTADDAVNLGAYLTVPNDQTGKSLNAQIKGIADKLLKNDTAKAMVRSQLLALVATSPELNMQYEEKISAASEISASDSDIAVGHEFLLADGSIISITSISTNASGETLVDYTLVRSDGNKSTTTSEPATTFKAKKFYKILPFPKQP